MLLCVFKCMFYILEMGDVLSDNDIFNYLFTSVGKRNDICVKKDIFSGRVLRDKDVRVA